jgi:membrane fusion protein, heavy metal efflux system
MKTKRNIITAGIVIALVAWTVWQIPGPAGSVWAQTGEKGHEECESCKTSTTQPAAPKQHAEHEGHDHDEHDEDAKHAEPESHDDHAGHDEDAKHAEHEGDDDHDGHDEHAKPAEKDDHDDHAGHDEEAETIIPLTEKQRKAAGIVLSTAGSGALSQSIRLPGEVAINADRVAHIVPRSPGIARQVNNRVGDRVQAGEVMAVLESAELGAAKVAYLTKLNEINCCQMDLARAEAVYENTTKLLEALKASPPLAKLRGLKLGEMGDNRSSLVSAYAEYLTARTTYEREKGLYEKKIVSESDFQAAESAWETSEAAYTAARDSIAFAVLRAMLEARRSQQASEFDVAAAERGLYVMGLTAADVELLTFKPYTECDEQNCTDPNCGKESAADAKLVAAAERAKGEQLAWYSLRAPFDGTVIDRHLTLGEKLGDDAEAFTVADLSTVWVNLSVYQKDLPNVRKGQAVLVSAGPGVPDAKGVIAFVSPIVDQATRTCQVRVVLPNPKGRWRPGLFVSATVALGQIGARVVLPPDAVQNLNGRSVVFVPAEGGFEPRSVQTGASGAQGVEIVSGLAAGHWYVSRGAFELKAKVVTSGLDAHAGHGH